MAGSKAKLEDVIKEKARKNQLSNLKNNTVSQLVGKRETPINTNAELGKIAGVSSKTIIKRRIKMINTKVSHDYKIGEEVETVENYENVKAGWHGVIEDKGITADGWYHEYKLRNESGEVQIIAGNILRPYIKASRENVVDVFNHMSIFINDEDELKDFKKVYSIIERDFNSPFLIAVAAYAYGKTVGKRQDRLNRKRKHLMKKYPDMRESTQEASHKVIEMISKMEKLSSEDLEEFIQYLHGKRG